MSNHRLYYAIYSCHVAECGSNDYTAVHGLASLSTNLRFTQTPYFEIGQQEVLEIKEELPDVSVTTEKQLDGYPPVYILMTKGGTSASLAGRSNARSSVGIAYFSDTQDSASGVALDQTVISGLYVNQVEYTFPVQGAFTESVTAVGNNMVWDDDFTFTDFENDDEPLAIAGSGGVNIRQDLILGQVVGATRLPSEIPGVSPSGYVPYNVTTQSYDASLQSIRVSTSLGRDNLLQLGKRGPYHRTAQFPVEVTCDIEILSKQGHAISADETSESNLTNQTIYIKAREGLALDLGTRNKLTGVTQGGGNAGQNGGNVSHTFSYINYNSLRATHPQDPAGLE